MPEINHLIDVIRDVLPKVKIEIDAAKTPTGWWYISFTRLEYTIDLEWRPQMGYGLWTSNNKPMLFDSPEETYLTWNEALHRIVFLFTGFENGSEIRFLTRPITKRMTL